MTKFTFSGKTMRIEHASLNELFGVSVPIEAVDLIFTAPAKMTFAEARQRLAAMSAEWDRAKFQLDRLVRASTSIVESVRVAADRLATAEEPERTYLIQDFMDAADNLEAADQDALFLREPRDGPDDFEVPS